MAAKQVLVVDDQLPVREVLASLLQRLGHSPKTASTGLEALRMFDESSFDLVLVDYHMPEMTGRELAIELKKRKVGVPVCLITGDRQHTTSLDFDRVLLKPVSLTQLREMIASLE